MNPRLERSHADVRRLASACRFLDRRPVRTLDRNGRLAGPPSLGGVSHSEINYTRENTLYYCTTRAENPPQPRVEALRYLGGPLAIATILPALRWPPINLAWTTDASSPLGFLLAARPVHAPALIKQETFIETARVIGRENLQRARNNIRQAAHPLERIKKVDSRGNYSGYVSVLVPVLSPRPSASQPREIRTYAVRVIVPGSFVLHRRSIQRNAPWSVTFIKASRVLFLLGDLLDLPIRLARVTASVFFFTSAECQFALTSREPSITAIKGPRDRHADIRTCDR